MVDTISPERRSAVMAKIGQKDTKPELILRSALHREGLRYKLHDKSLPGSPDIVMPKYNLVIFVHGCFWHHHSCPDGHVPKSREEFWKAKFERNIRRDQRSRRKLNKMGWRVAVVWECQINKGLGRVLSRIRRLTCDKNCHSR